MVNGENGEEPVFQGCGFEAGSTPRIGDCPLPECAREDGFSKVWLLTDTAAGLDSTNLLDFLPPKVTTRLALHDVGTREDGDFDPYTAQDAGRRRKGVNRCLCCGAMDLRKIRKAP